MNPEDYSRDDLVNNLSPALAAVGALTALLLWIITLVVRRRFPQLAPLWIAAGLVLAGLAIWLTLQFLGTFLSLATSWPLLVLVMGGALAAELLVLLYNFERTLVKPVRGRWLLALRLGALAILILILAQPVRSFLESREIDREIAILIDESDSMLLSDQRLSSSETLDRAELLQVGAAQDRPAFQSVSSYTNELSDRISKELNGMKSAPNAMAGLENRAAQLPAFFTEITEANTALTGTLTNIQSTSLPGEAKSRVDDYLKRSRDGLSRIIAAAKTASESGNAEELLKQLEVALTELKGITDTLEQTSAKADESFYVSLDETARQKIQEAAATPRLELAREILSREVLATEPPNPLSESGETARGNLLSQLRENYNLRIFRFAREVTQIAMGDGEEIVSWTGEMGAEPENAQTDLTGALEYVLENTAPESLAGVLLLSDGRHNGGALPEDSLRQLAVQNTPLSAVPIGGQLGPVDISLLNVKAPESIYLDDRVIVAAEAKLDGLLGQKVKAELFCNGEVADTIEIDVTDVSFRTELRFVHRPEEKGILDYQIRLQPDDREIFKNNNDWNFKVAVTDDRTNVLLVDGYPRWEFRYLRNLFYGRDKSVHLQYVLLNPDEIHRGRKADPVAASATRPFGEAEATSLPANADEWGLFDVIILGDVSPSALTREDWAAIEETVTRRGAMLVCIAGARHMPHGIEQETLQNLLPISYTPRTSVQLESPEPAFHIELTGPGQNHAVTSQSTSRALNLERWADFQPMRWRFAHDGVKDTAEVLAYARPVGSPGINQAASPDGSPGSVEAALEQLANRKQIEKDNALISTIRAGLGKVLMLNFDQTWRLRYGVGDTYHHRFWGQVTRWGAGENLRSGNELVRLGSDRLTYTPNDPVEVSAKVLDENRRPVTDAEIEVEVWKDDERISRQKLSYRTDSSGVYETSISGLRDEGEYQLKLVGESVDAGVASFPDGPESIETQFLVVTTRNPVELAELTADRNFLNRSATLTGGRVAELNQLETLLDSFGAPKETLTERRNVTLWDTWPLLLTFLGFITTEWILRRRSGLV
ncbi:MAG: hypothetical protein P1U87_14970 [Verrucomicrobiales bacterium]|nr:hypothetical protein [Verrucomicrobiales bacterium]